MKMVLRWFQRVSGVFFPLLSFFPLLPFIIFRYVPAGSECQATLHTLLGVITSDYLCQMTLFEQMNILLVCAKSQN